jgi:hypothetical protein
VDNEMEYWCTTKPEAIPSMKNIAKDIDWELLDFRGNIVWCELPADIRTPLKVHNWDMPEIEQLEGIYKNDYN